MSASIKKKIADLKRQIKGKKGELEKLGKAEKANAKKWKQDHAAFTKAAESLAKIKNHNTKKAEMLRHKILNRPPGYTLTTKRDVLRAEQAKIKEELVSLGLQMAQLTEQENGEVAAVDEVVKQVFSLNEAVVQAAMNREECLKRHVFPRLFQPDGSLCSQVSFISSNGLRMVRAMVNSMTIILGDKAALAKEQIEKFFDRFRATAMDANTKALYELTKQILIEKTNFKVGPDLYRFLGMTLDEDIFPELSLAQHYLKQSIRSKKTNSYIRIYERTSRVHKWVPVPQS
jgi:hypothetical protein